MAGYLGQFVYLGNHPWYGARLALQALGEQVRAVKPRWVAPARTDKALFLSILASREYPEMFPVLARAKIPTYSRIRGENDPIVIAGGGACFNPEPIAHLVDVFCVGDGEDWFPELGRCLSYPTRAARLDALAELPGTYLPARRTITYQPGGIFVKDVEGETGAIIPAVSLTLPPPPDDVAWRGAKDIELARGCRGGCRFCSIAWQVPYRERPRAEAAEYLATGTYTIQCPNAGGVSYFGEVAAMGSRGANGDVRVDDFIRLPFPAEGEYSGRQITLGIEGITPRLRKLLGKPIPEPMLREAFRRVIAGGGNRLQLYFIRGAPTETEEDWAEFLPWFKDDIYPQLLRAGVATEAQLTPLTRTPHTPFQWVGHRYSRQAEAHAKDLVAYARHLKAENDAHLLYITPSRREASWLVDTALNCGSRQALRFVYNVGGPALANLQSDRAIGRGAQVVAGVLRDCGIDPDLLLADWDAGEVLPWGHIQPLGERGRDRRLRSYRAYLRQVGALAGIAA